MGKWKMKKRKLNFKESTKEPPTIAENVVPMINLPERYIRMDVKGGTKIKNVLSYALKEFPNYNSIVWIGAGKAIGKTISCAELFKRKHEGLHQVTKLHYVECKKSKENEIDETYRVPEIHILLSTSVKNTKELGYQAPGDNGIFPESEDTMKSKDSDTAASISNITNMDIKKSTEMKLKVGQKRPNKSPVEQSFKKSKKCKS